MSQTHPSWATGCFLGVDIALFLLLFIIFFASCIMCVVEAIDYSKHFISGAALVLDHILDIPFIFLFFRRLSQEYIIP